MDAFSEIAGLLWNSLHQRRLAERFVRRGQLKGGLLRRRGEGLPPGSDDLEIERGL